MHVDGHGYAENDHSTFRDDLEWLHGAGLRIVSLATIAGALRQGSLATLTGCVGLSMDDGSDFDYYDVPHPAWGPQRGMAGILADFGARHGADAQPGLHATIFTIVSPRARAELDRTCMIGCRWWKDDWYRAAEKSGLLAIESHSWDHNHVTLASTATKAERATFYLHDAEEVEVELVQAARHLRELRGRGGDVLFAYPYGDARRYLAEEWLPAHGDANGIVAAFAASNSEPVTPTSSRWRIPRYVFGDQWRTRDDLIAMLRDAGVASTPRQGRTRPAAPRQPAHWRDRLRTYEINDARVVAGDLFRRCFGQEVPDYPRHFVLVHSPEPGSGDPPTVVAYVHQTCRESYALCGGMCVDERAYRRMPRWLFQAVREEGGLATIVTRDSVEMLGEECVAVFGHVGEPRARAADLRTGFVDTGRNPLMVIWRKDLPDSDRELLVDRVEALGPF
jgi:hypothetical protein